MTFNMHRVVRGAVQAVNLDTSGTIYFSTGRTVTRGIATPTFAPVSARMQVQAQKHNPIRHEYSQNWSNSFITIYAYGDLADIERPTGEGGDVITFTNPGSSTASWYYISQVLEWWPGWCAVECTRQLSAADITAFINQLKNGANP